MKDLAYFVGSCFRDEEAERREAEVLNFYFEKLREFLQRMENEVCPDEMESDWRPVPGGMGRLPSFYERLESRPLEAQRLQRTGHP